MDDLVTVFGGGGFVGNNVVRMLAQDGWRIRVAVRNPHRAERARVHGQVGQIDIVSANVRMPASVGRALEGAQACVNVVGVLRERGRQRFATVQTGGARNIAEACRDRGITRLVHVSAIGADPESASCYARSKGEGELAVREHVPSAVIVRPSVIFGAEDQFFNKFAGMARLAPVMPLVGAETRLQPAYVGDVARAIVRALDDPSAAGRTFELGGPRAYTMREIVELASREGGHPRPLLPLPFAVAKLIGTVGDFFAPISPIEPPITRDQVELLRQDNVVDPSLPGFPELGITPTGPEGIVGAYLYRFRKAGQYSTIEPQKSVSGRA
ncbi:MAG TPA: complex I NDUFA9 subunit family protein [Caulobacteraceae bacterium]|jgi:NADH dehydrogenase